MNDMQASFPPASAGLGVRLDTFIRVAIRE